MKVVNNTPREIIAFGWHREKGYGYEVVILPGQCAEVSGPYLQRVGGKEFYVSLPGEIICNELSSGEMCFQVSLGRKLAYEEGEIGITIRYHLDHPEDFNVRWKKNSLW